MCTLTTYGCSYVVVQLRSKQLYRQRQQQQKCLLVQSKINESLSIERATQLYSIFVSWRAERTRQYVKKKRREDRDCFNTRRRHNIDIVHRLHCVPFVYRKLWHNNTVVYISQNTGERRQRQYVRTKSSRTTDCLFRTHTLLIASSTCGVCLVCCQPNFRCRFAQAITIKSMELGRRSTFVLNTHRQMTPNIGEWANSG